MALSSDWRYVGQAAKLSSFNTAKVSDYTYKVFVKADPLSPTGRVYKIVNPKTERDYNLRSVAPIIEQTFKTTYQVNPVTGTPWLFHIIPRGMAGKPLQANVNFPDF